MRYLEFMSEPGFQRARSAETKQRRATDLLESARALAAEGGVNTVTLSAIAEVAGVHASAVRRYYASRDDILLTLAAGAWSEWSTHLRERLAQSQDPDIIPALLAVTLNERPLFCDLLANAPVRLEREVTPGIALDYKLAALEASRAIGASVDAADPSLGGRGQALVSTATSLAAMKWQYAHPPAVLEQLYLDDSRLAGLRTDLVPELTQILTELITGMRFASSRTSP